MGRVQLAQDGIKRGGLAAPRRAADDQKPAFALDDLLQARVVLRVEADRPQVNAAQVLVQYPYRDLFSHEGRKGGHAKIKFLLSQYGGEPAVHGLAAAHGVHRHVGQDLDAGDDGDIGVVLDPQDIV